MSTADPAPAPPSHRLTIAVAGFLLAQEAAHHSPATIEYYADNLRRFVTYLAGQDVAGCGEIVPTHIRRYFIALSDRGLSPGSVHAHARAIKAWLNWLVMEDELAASPMAKVRMPKRDKRILPSLSPADVNKLLATCDKTPLGLRDRAILLSLLDTGCRASEFCSLTFGAVDLKTGMVRVRGKGAKERVVRMGSSSRAALLKSLAGRWPLTAADPLWISHSPDGQPTSHALTTGGLRMLMVKLRRETGITVTAHMFRRTFALWALQSGMDVFSLQMLMGHADLQVLRVYLDQKPGDLELAHRRFGPVDTML